MKKNSILLALSLMMMPFTSFNQNHKTDPSEHIYQLPFEKGKKVWLLQGYNGTFSHKNKYALDFRLRKGKKIYAARGGVVSKVVQHHNEGGPHKKYLSKGNHVIINHGDGTYGAYWHLMLDGSLVTKGDTVKTGEMIAKSGSTGYSSMSHLHFMVFKYNSKGHRETFPTKFYTSKGVMELKSYRAYRHPKN
tara:strand:- start:393 stop:965 length:573 start_codon:yes stop_codon:yes gene_type:complete